MASEHVIGLTDCTEDCLQLVGGKATGLGALIRQGFQVPSGFAVTAEAYRRHVRHNNMIDELARLSADSSTYEAQVRAAEQIRELFESSTPSPQVENEIRRAYEQLCRDSKPVPVAVRSSATAEDTAQASFAGQQETYLWILGADQVLQHVLRCWSSLFTAQAIAYRAHLRTDVTDLAMGVVVQCMVPAEAAGVMMTLDPVSGDRSTIVVEAGYGLGAAVVNGEVDPDRFILDKATLQVRSRTTGVKTIAYRFDPSGQGTRTEAVLPTLQAKPCVTDAEVCELARSGKRMEEAMGGPQDIEWAIGPGDRGGRELFLLQARPETIWNQKPVVA